MNNYCRSRDAVIASNYITYITALCYINILPTLLAIVGNAICILTLYKTPTLQTTSNVWVGALCISDFIVGIIVQPLYFAHLISLITGHGIYLTWVPMKIVLYLMSTTSFFLVYFVTIDRYIAICHPFVYIRIASIKRCIFGAFLGLLLSLPSVLLERFAIKIVVVYGTILEIFMFLQIVISYLLIYRAILKQRRDITSNSVQSQIREELRSRKEETRKAYTIGIIIIILIICYTPITVVGIASKAAESFCDRSKESVIGTTWAQFFMLLNSSVNPVIYCLRMKDIRRAIKDIFGCHRLVSQQSELAEL